jgi:hypothetical protein
MLETTHRKYNNNNDAPSSVEHSTDVGQTARDSARKVLFRWQNDDWKILTGQRQTDWTGGGNEWGRAEPAPSDIRVDSLAGLNWRRATVQAK